MSAEHHDDPIPIPPHQRREDFKRRTLPILVWSVSAVVVCVLLLVRAVRYEVVGLAQLQEYEISAATAGTVDAVLVQPFDEVEANQVVARLDDTLVRGLMETSEATIAQLQAELEAGRDDLRVTRGDSRSMWATDLRRFQMDEEDRRLESLALRVDVEQAKVEKERQDLEVRRARQLLDAGLMSEAEYDDIRLLHQQVLRQAEEGERLLGKTEEELRASEARRAAYEQQRPPGSLEKPLLAPLQAAVEVEARRLEDIQRQREGLTLRSPVAGQVSQVWARKGQAVTAGEPIVVVAERSVLEIVAWLRDGEGPREIAPKAPVRVTSASHPNRAADSVVIRVGEGVQTMPQRLWRDPRIPDYGRAVVIAAAPGMDLVPGEQIEVAFLPAK